MKSYPTCAMLTDWEKALDIFLTASFASGSEPLPPSITSVPATVWCHPLEDAQLQWQPKTEKHNLNPSGRKQNSDLQKKKHN